MQVIKFIATMLCAAVIFSVPIPASAAEDEATKADNTKVNKEMKEDSADQQKETKSDREITRKIRRAVVKNKSLSTYAHNVKIITRGGAVTLKGPVRSEKEKQFVEKAAAQVAGEGKVTSEIEIVPKKVK